MKRLRRALRKRAEWSPRGSRCPICKRVFRSDSCPHSVAEARAVLDAAVVAAVVSDKKSTRVRLLLWITAKG